MVGTGLRTLGMTATLLVAGALAQAAPRVRPAPTTLRPKVAYERSLARATRSLERAGGRGLITLDPKLPTVVLADLHARTGYLSGVLSTRDPRTGKSFGQLLRQGRVQVVVLGDGMHAEGRAAERWAEADRDPTGAEMRAEAAESLGTMKQVMDYIAAFPKHFHYLKGNHDNIRDRRSGGDWPVTKYSQVGEGRLMRTFLEKRFGRAFVGAYARFEDALPLVALGGEFALSHSGPARAMSRSKIRARGAAAVENFTWTDLTKDSARQRRVVDEQLRLLGREGGYYVAGHRPVEKHRYRKQGRFYQVNSPDHFYFTVLEPDGRSPAVKEARHGIKGGKRASR